MLAYLGSFTLPSSFGAEVRGLGLSADGTQLYVGQYPSNLGLVTIPSLGSQATAVISPKSVPGNVGLDCGGEAAELSGILVHNGKLILSKRCYFVTSPSGGNTHLTADLNMTNFSSMTRIPESGISVQYANGWMGCIPTEWQPLLGGPAFAGNSMMSIVSTNSVGPSFYVFNPDDVSVSRIRYRTTH